jgi:hypothetical protein
MAGCGVPPTLTEMAPCYSSQALHEAVSGNAQWDRTCRRGLNISGEGVSWRRSTAQEGKDLWMWVATVMLAMSIISSTIMFVSLSWYMPTSNGLVVLSSNLNFTSGDARLNAPASNLHQTTCQFVWNNSLTPPPAGRSAT